VLGVRCAVCGVRSALRGVRCALCAVRYAVCAVRCAHLSWCRRYATANWPIRCGWDHDYQNDLIENLSAQLKAVVEKEPNV
jgi:hypothetical protein